MTDATGLSFLSYRRTRASEASLIIGSQRDRGIPTWQDVTNLGSALTEDEIRRVLADPSTASATMFVTPEVADSQMIRNVEAPLIIDRYLKKDGFEALVIAAGGLDYPDVDSVLGSRIGPVSMSAWNICKVVENPLGEVGAAMIGDRAIEHRLGAVGRQLGDAEPLRLVLSTRSPLPKRDGFALTADLTHRFDGRLAKPGAWERHVLPGMRAIKVALQRQVIGEFIALDRYVYQPPPL
jgi:hypothetical protein